MDAVLRLFEPMIGPLEIILLVTAWAISISSSVKQMIGAYRLQCVLLAIVTVLTAIVKSAESLGESTLKVIILIVLIFLLPIVLAIFIYLLLARATITPSAGVAHLRLTVDEKREAERAWNRIKFEGSVLRETLTFLGLVLLALLISFLISFQSSTPIKNETDKIGLMVSLALHLVGLHNMLSRRDIISQVIGLLVMDHGLYLAVVKIVAIPVPATFFVIALYFYTLFTIIILVFLLPQVRSLTTSISLDDISTQSTLEG
jgi:hydrogenase-4 membrane subunit HyfE